MSIADALEYVLGYCTVNDLSARGLQSSGPQWTMGKALDGFLPIGPYMVEAKAVPDPQDLALSMTVNGQTVQSSSTADMIFSVAEIISYLSRYMTLVPSDLIITSTPEGVAMGRSPATWLKPGDICVADVQGLGALTTVIAHPFRGNRSSV